MIRKLKTKFIVLAMTALFALLAVIVAGMNWINYHSVVRDADMLLSILSQNKGAFPDFGSGPNHPLPPNMSPETPYESRYFSVFLNASGEVVNTETSKIASVDSETAAEYAQTVMERQNGQGFIQEYRYVLRSELNGCRITFLDCGRDLAAFRNFLLASCGMAFIGYVVVFFVIFFFAGRIIRPIAESYEKQKQFITDAGHEIKTPLTIINANVDILEMELGENESLTDIQQQTERLKSLTNDLVMLARMEEAGNTMPKIEFPVSEVVAETARPFRALAIQQGKEFVCSIRVGRHHGSRHHDRRRIYAFGAPQSGGLLQKKGHPEKSESIPHPIQPQFSDCRRSNDIGERKRRRCRNSRPATRAAAVHPCAAHRRRIFA